MRVRSLRKASLIRSFVIYTGGGKGRGLEGIVFLCFFFFFESVIVTEISFYSIRRFIVYIYIKECKAKKKQS